MGMSSSQARLLNLTSRMHQIEYKAAKIEAEKLRLANDSDRVYDTYLDKLEQTKLVANVLSEDGSMTALDLTAKAIYDYRTLRDQYSLITKDNKALIPQSVSDNYRNTNSLSEFLTAYGLESECTQTIHHEDPNPTYANQEERYQRDLADWETWQQGWLQRREDTEQRQQQWERDKAAWDRYQAQKPIHDDWQIKKDKYNDYIEDLRRWEEAEANNTGTSINEQLAKDFVTIGKTWCYTKAIGGTVSCYGHVLNGLLDYKTTGYTYHTYTTSTGKTVRGSNGMGAMDSTAIDPENSSRTVNRDETFTQLSEIVNTPNLKVKIDAGETCDITDSSTEYQKLLSKFNTDGSVKDLKQWIIDLKYITENASASAINGYPDNATFGATIVDIQPALIGSFVSNPKPEEVEAPGPEPPLDVATNPGSKPEFNEPWRDKPKSEDYITAPPTLPRDEVIKHNTFNDKNKAQWYINLWYKMEGQNETAKVIETIVHDDATNRDIYLYSCDSIPKSNTNYTTNADWNILENENYMIIPDDKLNDPTWIRNAVVEGYVLIQTFDTTANEFKDTSVSTITRIDEVPDEKDLKKAEAQYEADMKKIDMKDRRYDTELAKLENERTATKEEIETLKTVAKENVDRTFKLFT